jgi:hypothetical protein
MRDGRLPADIHGIERIPMTSISRSLNVMLNDVKLREARREEARLATLAQGDQNAQKALNNVPIHHRRSWWHPQSPDTPAAATMRKHLQQYAGAVMRPGAQFVEECKAPGFKKSNHCRTRSLS